MVRKRKYLKESRFRPLDEDDDYISEHSIGDLIYWLKEAANDMEWAVAQANLSKKELKKAMDTCDADSMMDAIALHRKAHKSFAFKQNEIDDYLGRKEIKYATGELMMLDREDAKFNRDRIQKIVDKARKHREDLEKYGIDSLVIDIMAGKCQCKL